MTRLLALVGLGLAGCASYPAPLQRMADAEALTRSARDLGATATPDGKVHLALAQEEIAQGRRRMAGKDNEGADYVLIRAVSDAELAVAEATAARDRAAADLAEARVAAMRAAIVASTTTTGATWPATAPKEGASEDASVSFTTLCTTVGPE